MIPVGEIRALRAEWQLRDDIIEKDYVLGWLLAGVATDPTLDYRVEEGRHGPRIVEPYSLRMTKDGDLVLFAVNDRGQLTSYRVDRIAGARATDLSFQPRYLVEF